MFFEMHIIDGQSAENSEAEGVEVLLNPVVL